MNLKTSEKNQHASRRRTTRHARNRSKRQRARRKERERERGETARRVEGKSAWHSSHYTTYTHVLLARFISLAAERVSWLRRENETRFSRKRFEFSPSTKTRSKLSSAKRPLETAALTIRSSRALSVSRNSRSHPFLPEVASVDNEFRLFPLLLPPFRCNRRTDARDVTNRKCCHRLSRQNGIDEIEVSGLSRSAFFSKGLHFIRRTCHSSRTLYHVSTKDRGEYFAVIGAEKF